MRLLSLSMWNSFVYCVITVALLGFSVSGGVLTVWRRARTLPPEPLIGCAVLGFALNNIAGMLLIGEIEIDAVLASKQPLELLKLAVYFVALGVPYFAAGLAIGASFLRYPAVISRLYFFNMAGSGAGCLLFVAAFGYTGERLALAMTAAMCVVAVPYVWRASRQWAFLHAACAMATLALLPAASTIFHVQICSSKTLRWFQQRFPEAVIEQSRWTAGGRVDVLGGGGLAHVNRRTGELSPMKVIFTDGDAYTRLLAYSEGAAWPFPTRQLGSGTIYSLRKPNRVVVIGVGGGTEVRDAIEHGASHVVGVEINSAIRDATATDYADYNGRLSSTPGVQLVHGEGRSYINGVPDGTFDLVYMNGVDTWAAMASGAYSLAENYLYTTDALREYLRVLQPDGAISISRYAFRYPRETLRLGITTLHALRESGVREPWKHVALLVDRDWGTILAKKQPFTDEEIEVLEELQDQGNFKIAYRPGIEALRLTTEALARYGRDVWYPAPYEGALNPAVAYIRAMQTGDEERYFASYPYDVRPCSDDRPFFFNPNKWQSLLITPPHWAASGGSFAHVVLGVLLFLSVVCLVGLVFLPLLHVSRRAGSPLVNARALGAAFYFSCLGAGYMTIEIVLMQKLTLFVGHPTHAIVTVLATMLVGSGCGSLASGWLRATPRRIVAVSVAAIAGLAVALQFLTAELLPYWLGQDVLVRNVIAALLVAPLAFFMGMPFPTGLRVIEAISPHLTPWAWGINGAAGVFASVGAIVAAMELGFSTVLLISLAVYCAGAAVFLRVTRARQGESRPVPIAQSI
ncbi:MAG: methyltransferase domain-containing protein [Candidatus Hydrogenedentes bacterium]|nr:methyltransferase domain-containing protein [Candidatus Hydrogenedentota bacterium]